MALSIVEAKAGLGSSIGAVLVLAATSALAAPPVVQTDRAPVRANQVTVGVQVDEAAGERLEVLTREGPALAPLPTAVQSEQGRLPEIRIPAETPVVIRKGGATAAPKPLSSTASPADSVLVESVPVPGTPRLRDIRQWTLIIYAARTPLVWDAGRRAYATELLVGLKELGGESGAPSSPVTVQLIGKEVAVNPHTLKLTEAGVSGLQRAEVLLSNHRITGTVGAISDFGEQSYSVTAAPQLTTLDLRTALTAIPGFGIGTTLISAVRRAEDGQELTQAHPLSIALTASGGQLQAPSIVIPENQSHSAPVELRSSWLGNATLNASVDGVRATPVELTFTTPWSFLVAILLGAALGTLVRVRPKTKAQRLEFLAGMAVGVILGLASFVGVSSVANLPATAIVTELGCFVVAALESYLGRAALDRFTAASAPAALDQAPVKD